MTTRLDGLPFDLRSLQIFLAVCDTGSITDAARQLNLSQPAVSQAISDIEARSGAQLFDRAVRPIGLTRAGGLLRQRGSSLLAEARQIAPGNGGAVCWRKRARSRPCYGKWCGIACR